MSFQYSTISPVNRVDFDELGFRYPLDHIDMVFPSIAHWPLPLQATFVDLVVFEIVSKNNEFEVSLLLSSIDKKITEPNTTVIGNLAYIAMYCQNYNVKQAAFFKLNQVCISIVGQPHIYPIKTNP